MKKQLLSLALLSAAWLASGSVMAQFDVSKVYTIESNNNVGKYMQDNGDGYIVTGALNANSYWEFEATGNDGCYYVKNAKTGKYMQQTSEYEVSVKTGDTSVEIYIKNDPDKSANVYGMASTDRNPHDFTSDDTYGANYNGGTGVVQGFSAALGARPNSFWKIIGHSFTNGVCSDDCKEKYQAPALVDGWYELTNAGNVEWIGDYVENVAINPNVKMKNDIDFTGVNFRMIGRSDSKKFNGVWDGQGHRITNLTLENVIEDANSVLGFFAWVRGGSTIKNLIMDSSCSFHGYKRVSAFVGVTQANNGGAINILNCVNEATVTANDNPAGAFVGCRNPNNNDTPQIIIDGCVNKGTITARSETAAFVGWANRENNNVGWDNHIVRNSYNFGTINNIDGDKRGFFRSGNISIENSYDFGSNKANNNQNVSYSWTTDDPVASGELAYYINQQAGKQVFYQTFGTDAYPVPFSTSGQVYFADDTFCDGSVRHYSNYESGHVFGHNINDEIGMCDVCHTQFQEPDLVDGWYQLRNAGNVEWYSNLVSTAGGNHANAKMMNDIDFLSIENLHRPIGPNEQNKFNATFDGQGFRIKNMIINRNSENNIGFFGWLRGNNAPTTVKNLIIDASCSIHGNNRVGGITGTYQNGGSVITIENVINEANISANGQDAGGIFGGHESGEPTIIIKNVLNKGNVTSTNDDAYVGALCCYLGVKNPDSKIENFVNLGTIGTHKGGNIGRHNISDVTNLIDLSDTTDKTQGNNSGLNTTDIAGGKLAYTVGWWQLLGTDAYPMPFAKEGAVVYQNGNYSCPNTVEGLAYSNTEDITGNNTSHTNNTKGFCTYCDEVIPDHISAVDNFLPLSSSDDLVWFSAMVNAGNTTINGKLTSDVDMSSVTYTPIGNNTNRYHGTFDGSGHKVNLNIDANAYGQGFISIATGGTTVKNLVVTGKVKNAGSKTAGIIAEAIGGGTITIQNCGNEATIEGAGGEVAGVIANNWNYDSVLKLENVYNIGNVSGAGDVSTICACQGNSSSVFKNVYNSGSVTGATQGNFVRPSNSGYGTYTNCYSTTLSNDNASIISTNASAVESGELCAKLGFGFRQNLSSDAYPNFASDHGFVAQIGAAGYSTMYNVYSDVEIPSGIEAYAGVVNGESLSLVAIENKIAASEPVILKLKEGTDAGLFNFMPTTGATSAASNSLSGSDGSVTGDGSTIFALANGSNGVGFYLVGDGVNIPSGKAYLKVTANTGGGGVKAFYGFDEDDATSLNDLKDFKDSKDTIYNVAGQRMSKTQKGINIVNGKKVMVK